MVLFASILALHAVLSSPASVSALHVNSPPTTPVPMVVRISKPSDLFIGATIHGATTTTVEGAIDVPANARAGFENSLISQAQAEATPSDAIQSQTVIYGAYGVRSHGYPIYGGRRVAGWRPNRANAGNTDASIFDRTADDVYRDAQLRFYQASYPNLSNFNDGYRRAQLEFHRSTLTPGTRGSDGLRHDRSGLNGPGLRREVNNGRRW